MILSIELMIVVSYSNDKSESQCLSHSQAHMLGFQA